MLYLALNVHKLHAILIYEDSTVNNKSKHLKKKTQTVLFYYKNRKAQVQQLIFFLCLVVFGSVKYVDGSMEVICGIQNAEKTTEIVLKEFKTSFTLSGLSMIWAT